MRFIHNSLELDLKRHPKTQNKSLRAWDAADEYILKFLDETKSSLLQPVIIGDRFGFLNLFLITSDPQCILEFASQRKSILKNLISNNINKKINLRSILDEQHVSKTVIIKMPKSLELFDLYLRSTHACLEESGSVIIGFMTKYFSKGMLEIAYKYYKNVDQTLAWKKSRLLILTDKKEEIEEPLLKEIKYKDQVLNQYPGVFSSNQIDYATQFLLDNFELKNDELNIVDLGSGNGIISRSLLERNQELNLHLIDDSFLAIESSKLNINNENVQFYLDDCLDQFQDDYYDLIISNPPFHFGNENNIEISLELFQQSKQKLKKGGRLVIVSNKHLNYKTHLSKIFSSSLNLKENEKYEIIESVKRNY